MKIIKKICIIVICFIIYSYVCNITLLPSNIIIFQGEDVNLKTIAGINVRRNSNIKLKSVQASNNINTNDSIYSSAGSYEINLDLFGTIPVKEINVNVIERTKVIPCGDLIGVKMYTEGAMVVGFSEIEGEDKKIYKPYAQSGIMEGDTIIEINNKKVSNTNDLVELVNSSNGNRINVKYLRGSETVDTTIVPIKNELSEYKIGLWVRDATAGVGTLTFIEPSTNSFAALGHGIVDIDTGGIFNIANGQLVGSNMVSIKKGKKNDPGEIRGVVNSADVIGEISKNTNFGVFGSVANINSFTVDSNKEYEVALRSEIEEGEAELICELENNEKNSYKIKIEKLYTSNNYDNKSMLIKITDERLINKTGGIIQGMSGSPIIQNGKFIGAVTNVLVSDPTTGYAIFGDLMIKQMKMTN
ncbi:MAG: SpoIVB peptidase [Clostridia bacterium]|nr:SpoIVB peptidase [Clostridia bacterium]